ncbi:MAG: suppressor of fused domain protein [Thermogutta sp.]|nr:suppressor of fused domain protein [Thermogutta sp.]
MSYETDDWQRVWDARMAGLERHFGKCDQTVLHAAIPFEFGLNMGGSPDVVMFSRYTTGKLYVTAGLIGSGQKPNSRGNYELAVVHQGDEDWGVGIICRLAYYTLDNVIDHGQTMDVAEATPEGSTIAALLFKRIADFEVLGKPANVICCIGITKDELEYALEQGTAKLFQRLPSGYLLTDLRRKSHLRR